MTKHFEFSKHASGRARGRGFSADVMNLVGRRGEPLCTCHVCRTLREVITAAVLETVTIDEARQMVGG